MGLAGSLRKGTGTGIGLLGFLLWLVAGIFCFVWSLYVLFAAFGVWAIVVGIVVAPLTYLASILIVWFATGVFPVLLLIPYVLSFVGIGLASIGGRISGD